MFLLLLSQRGSGCAVISLKSWGAARQVLEFKRLVVVYIYMRLRLCLVMQGLGSRGVEEKIEVLGWFLSGV